MIPASLTIGWFGGFVCGCLAGLTLATILSFLLLCIVACFHKQEIDEHLEARICKIVEGATEGIMVEVIEVIEDGDDWKDGPEFDPFDSERN